MLLLPQDGAAAGHTRSGADEQLTGARAVALGSTETSRRRRRPQTLQTAQAGQPRWKLRRAQHSDDGNGHTAQGSVAAASEPRTQPATVPATGLLRYVRTNRSSGGSSHFDQAGPAMARSDPSARGPQMVDLEDSPHGGIDEGAGGPDSADQHQQTGGATLGHSSHTGHDQCGWGLGLPQMVPRGSEIDSSPQSPHAHAEDAAHDRAHPGPAPGQLSHCSLSQSEAAEGGCSLEFTADPQRCRAVDVDPVPHALLGVGITGHERQTTQSADVAQCPSDSRSFGEAFESWTEGAGEGQRQEQGTYILTQADRQVLRARLLALALANPGTLCYANSATMSFLWASLSRKTFQIHDWGALSSEFYSLLLHSDAPLIQLDSFPWFQQLLENWTERHSQADSAEFTNRLLTRVRSPAVSNDWTRGVLVGEKIVQHDSGDRFQPLTLQIDPAMISHDEIQLDLLLRLWSHDMGMNAGLRTAADLVVLHLDRFVLAPSGGLRKLRTAVRFCWIIKVPIFST